MKVVLFCGGLGLRMRDYSDALPKPMVPIGTRPILWHLMRYYAHYGHKDFILCLGHKGHVIKDFFLKYDECVSNDFVLSEGAKRLELLRRDIDDWRITFVDTGSTSNIGQRLLAVRRFLRDEEMFLANYSDGLTDCPLPEITDRLAASDATAAFMAARPNTSFHFVRHDTAGRVTRVDNVEDADLWVNAGYFAFRQEIFDYIVPGEELVEEPFQRLIDARRLLVHEHTGFWRGCDTFKDLQTLEAAQSSGPAPWEVWRDPQDTVQDNSVPTHRAVGFAAA
ncbi:glucose-1-phosphate cytidylyltransferase [Rhodocista pekingensis]|uniref:Glucose-1-phosphate cytidylyltransferase n=1 Tax=Rhodocista pekingensis TaxID=201185 RepID=A0ABW2KVC5_9PROT